MASADTGNIERVEMTIKTARLILWGCVGFVGLTALVVAPHVL